MTGVSLISKIETGRLPEEQLDRVIEMALDEDFQQLGDITGNAIIPASARMEATLLLKEPAVLAGLTVFARVLQKVDSSIGFSTSKSDGEFCQPGSVGTATGPARSLLAAERTALNLIQRLSGIATVTKRFADMAAPYGIAIRDTRKTTPGLRALEKWAVACGGGQNHRFGLYDAFLIKDNHIRLAGVTEAINRARAAYPDKKVQVEVTCERELKEALAAHADSILLDNMSPDEIRRSVALVDGRAFIEVSGGVNMSNINDYLIRGVNAISIGALTHSVKSIDLSLEAEG